MADEKTTDNFRRLLLKFNGEEHDFTRFGRFHPGGRNTLSRYSGRDVTETLERTRHSESAYRLIDEYRLGKTEHSSELKDLEGLVDWSKPILGQVGSLRGNYHPWILSPVDRKLRLFKSDILETLTITTWYIVLAYWSPIILFLTYTSYLRSAASESHIYPVLTVSVSFACGLALWPLVEYIIHRWLFHLKPPDDSPLLITLHFSLHGLHHKVPFDDRRLLFPPGPATVVATLGYGIYSLLFPYSATPAILAGTIQGYVIYDLIHFYLHYGSPKEGTYLYHMKRYHNQHHFAQLQKGFGISSSFWDHVFETAITLKELSVSLKW